MSDNIEAELQKFEELESQLEEVEVKSCDEKADEDIAGEAAEESAAEEEAAEAEEAEDAPEAEAQDATEEAEAEDATEEEAEEAPAEEESEDGEESDEVVEGPDSEDEAEVEEEEDSSDNNEGEEKSVDPEMSAKAMSIMQQISEEESESDMPVLFLSDVRYKEMLENGELLMRDSYDVLDDDAKDAYEKVGVFEENDGKGYGTRYRRRSPLEINTDRKKHYGKPHDKDKMKKKDEGDKDMFDSEAEAVARAAQLGCEGAHQHSNGMFMPCGTMEAYEAAMDAGEKTEEHLCGLQKKMLDEPCDMCEGGCAPVDGLPGLADIENQVKSLYENSEIINSGYSSLDDIYVVDIKQDTGKYIEVFMSGEGEELGWLTIDPSIMDEKSAEDLNIISRQDAENVAIKELADRDIEGSISSVMVDVFGNEDVYVVEIEATDEKSYDFFVSVNGKVLGYDEYELETEAELSEEEEIKALEAELSIKRMYSREQRQQMAENGDALPDGSFPIADQADLENAIVALPRAKDQAAAKAHIMKRAKELGLEDMLPPEMMQGEEGEEGEAAPAAAPAPAPAAGGGGDAPAPAPRRMEDEKSLEEQLAEFEALKSEEGL